MKRISCLLFSVVIILLSLAGCTENGNETSTSDFSNKNTVADFSNAKIGTVTGSAQSEMLKNVLPDAEHAEFNTTSDAAMALSLGKVDAFSTENSVYCAMLWEGI